MLNSLAVRCVAHAYIVTDTLGRASRCFVLSFEAEHAVTTHAWLHGRALLAVHSLPT